MSVLGSITRGRLRSFRSRLLLLVAMTSAVAAILVGAALVARQHYRTRTLMAEQLATKGEVIALNVAATLSFDQPDEAAETLAALYFVQHLEAAYVVDEDGIIFASYRRVPDLELPQIHERSAGLNHQQGWMIYHRPINVDEELLGTLVLVYDARWLMTRLWDNLIIALLIAAVAMMIAIFVAMRLQLALARPIGELVGTTRSVSETGDYSVKARKFDEDELGELTEAFNAMLSRIAGGEAELRDREQRLRTLTNVVPAIVWRADAAGHTTDLNDRWFEYTGMVRSSEMADLAQYMHPEDAEGVLRRWEESVEHGTPFSTEIRFRRHDGEYRWFLSRAIPLRDEEGNVVGWFGTATDIQDRKEIEAERDELLASERTARSEAERTSRMKDEFVATLSHELRTPMTAILGWTQMLRRQEVADDSINEGLSTIERNARTQAQMIEDLLDMSRIVSGKIRMDVQHVELPEVIDAAVGTVQPAAEAKEIELQKLIDSNAGPVRGDPHRLQQIVWNLLSNAVKFTPRGGRVQVSLQRINSHIELNVSDTGEGIAPEFLPHLFDRFRQSDPSTTRRHGGLGLGLAIVKHLTELHGGSVSATSPGEGKGSTFRVVLPIAHSHVGFDEEERVHHTRRASYQDAATGEPTTLQGIRVLLVEDEQDARAFLQILLTDADAEVVSVSSATEALAAMDRFEPDVIVSDIGMPVMDGYQFIREVRKRPIDRGGRTPAVALTAFARTEDRTRALIAGYQIHMAKPIEPTELLAIVASLSELGPQRGSGNGSRNKSE